MLLCTSFRIRSWIWKLSFQATVGLLSQGNNLSWWTVNTPTLLPFRPGSITWNRGFRTICTTARTDSWSTQQKASTFPPQSTTPSLSGHRCELHRVRPSFLEGVLGKGVSGAVTMSRPQGDSEAQSDISSLYLNQTYYNIHISIFLNDRPSDIFAITVAFLFSLSDFR